ncbi:hypothetical protein HK102_004530 [Quaeritorhiza haematococci]|nr:hypothetical protein HK102_004530 [Quaeritorhiza haematococci]
MATTATAAFGQPEMLLGAPPQLPSPSPSDPGLHLQNVFDNLPLLNGFSLACLPSSTSSQTTTLTEAAHTFPTAPVSAPVTSQSLEHSQLETEAEHALEFLHTVPKPADKHPPTAVSTLVALKRWRSARRGEYEDGEEEMELLRAKAAQLAKRVAPLVTKAPNRINAGNHALLNAPPKSRPTMASGLGPMEKRSAVVEVPMQNLNPAPPSASVASVALIPATSGPPIPNATPTTTTSSNPVAITTPVSTTTSNPPTTPTSAPVSVSTPATSATPLSSSDIFTEVIDNPENRGAAGNSIGRASSVVDAIDSRRKKDLTTRESTRPKVYVHKACVNCKNSHVACDAGRPCQRCIRMGKADSCHDAERKKRGRPCNSSRLPRHAYFPVLTPSPPESPSITPPSFPGVSMPIIPSALTAALANVAAAGRHHLPFPPFPILGSRSIAPAPVTSSPPTPSTTSAGAERQINADGSVALDSNSGDGSTPTRLQGSTSSSIGALDHSHVSPPPLLPPPGMPPFPIPPINPLTGLPLPIPSTTAAHPGAPSSGLMVTGTQHQSNADKSGPADSNSAATHLPSTTTLNHPHFTPPPPLLPPHPPPGMPPFPIPINPLTGLPLPLPSPAELQHLMGLHAQLQGAHAAVAAASGGGPGGAAAGAGPPGGANAGPVPLPEELMQAASALSMLMPGGGLIPYHAPGAPPPQLPPGVSAPPGVDTSAFLAELSTAAAAAVAEASRLLAGLSSAAAATTSSAPVRNEGPAPMATD